MLDFGDETLPENLKGSDVLKFSKDSVVFFKKPNDLERGIIRKNQVRLISSYGIGPHDVLKQSFDKVLLKDSKNKEFEVAKYRIQ